MGSSLMIEPRLYTVSEITRHIKMLLETSIPTIWVQGEVSNFTHHSSGHLYFTLKDESSQLRCVMWRTEAGRLFFMPVNGMKVLAQGDISLYERSGQYQLVVRQLQPTGVGELQLAFERLKNRLRTEGLFDERHKRSLPEYPEIIGVITSPTGAAIRDICNIIGRRFPGVQIILRPVKVQGEGAAEEIAMAIDEFNEYEKADLLIVGRGGGSIEELWAFNEETVARAIYRSRIPIISAVGHEIDFTIADFVADKRAPTPSAAAELAVRDKGELLKMVDFLYRRCTKAVQDRLREAEAELNDLRSSYLFQRFPDVINQRWQRVDELERGLLRTFDRLVMGKTSAWKAATGMLDALSPLSAFRRGFSICRKLPEMMIVRDSSVLAPKDQVRVRFHKGSALCQVELVEGDDEPQ